MHAITYTSVMLFDTLYQCVYNKIYAGVSPQYMTQHFTDKRLSENELFCVHCFMTIIATLSRSFFLLLLVEHNVICYSTTIDFVLSLKIIKKHVILLLYTTEGSDTIQAMLTTTATF